MSDEIIFDRRILPSKYDKIGNNTLAEEHDKNALKRYLELL